VTLSLFSGDIGLGVVIVLAVVVIVAMVIVARVIWRDPNIRLTRVGWFIERERYPDEESWPPESRELPLRLRDDTVELPPKEEK
jgi:hypothetical protein